MGEIIDGKALAAEVRAEVERGVAGLIASGGPRPGLTVVRVGEDPASAVYVRGKRTASEAVGIAAVEHHLPETTSEAELLALLDRLNADPAVHGILVQLPLPKQIRPTVVLDRISPRKDVDGFHPDNVGLLVQGRPRFRPCTPHGVMRMLDSVGVALAGKEAVVVGRSEIVGKPVAILLLERHATVTICHSRTRDLASVVGRAEVLVAAVGKPEIVRGAWIRDGAVVIDVGMNRLPSGKLVGDVEFAAAKERASHITPVPGGVGPMTIAMLLHNTLEAARATHAADTSERSS